MEAVYLTEKFILERFHMENCLIAYMRKERKKNNCFRIESDVSKCQD